MPKEREIKLRIPDVNAIRRALRRLGARVDKPRIHEYNILFDTADFTLARRRQLLRIRTESSAREKKSAVRQALLTFKGPLPRTRKQRLHKVREEIELIASDATALAQVLERLGLRGWFHYEKYRTTFRLPPSRPWARRLLLELDETPIGIFLELEGPAAAIDRAARALGFRPADYLLETYLELYRRHCRQRRVRPGNMLFRARNHRVPS